MNVLMVVVLVASARAICSAMACKLLCKVSIVCRFSRVIHGPFLLFVWLLLFLLLLLLLLLLRRY